MKISFRTKLFDVDSPELDDAYYGEDLAKWLQVRLSGWNAQVYQADSGWAVLARKGTFSYSFGVSDGWTNADVTELGPKWVVYLYNRKDWKNWFRELFLFKYIPPVAHDEVVAEIVQLLSGTHGIAEVTVEQLT